MRRKMLLAWLILAVSLLPAGCARQAASKQAPVQPATSSSRPGAKGNLQLLSIQMCSQTTGWAATNIDVLRTTDGGSTWRVVTPPVDRSESFGVLEDFIDADQAWVAIGQRAETQMFALVWHTTDGGQTWNKTEIRHAGGQPYSICWGAITFTDDRHGWLMAVNSQHCSPAELFATTDGGTTWSQIASTADGRLPCGGEISFRDPLNGWMVGNLGGNGDSKPNLLYRTQDGGRTWREQDVKLPPGYPKGAIGIGGINDAPPSFFSNGDGLLTALFWTQPQSTNETLLYFTRDGGQTWQSRPPLNPWGIVDFFNANEGWYWPWEPPDSPTAPPGGPVKGRLSRTTDGGRTWTGIAPDQTLQLCLDQGMNINQLDFIDSSTGWALLLSNNGADQLLKTMDGGDRWTSVYPD
jgi:photosystem II stability/assembly factor-like uncharacterized protein